MRESRWKYLIPHWVRTHSMGERGGWSLEPSCGDEHLKARSAEHLFETYAEFHTRAIRGHIRKVTTGAMVSSSTQNLVSVLRDLHWFRTMCLFRISIFSIGPLCMLYPYC